MYVCMSVHVCASVCVCVCIAGSESLSMSYIEVRERDNRFKCVRKLIQRERQK